jgi:chorismate lyase / 3-hydroxybenzoate synthase
MNCKIVFGNSSKILIDENYFYASINVKGIDKEKPFLEKSFDKFEKYSENLYLFKKDDLLFGFASIDLNEDAEIKARTLYKEILKSSKDKNLYRCWNYVPKINTIERGKEIYKKFNAGRKDAFTEFYGEGYEWKLPAATGIGIIGRKLIIMFLAGKDSPKNLENPNQCPVYNYPTKYGKKSPHFSRATEVKNKFYFISGTASIKGSDSMYKNNIKKQYELMKENLNIMISKNKTLKDKNNTSAIVYFRNKKDLKFIKASFERDFNFIKKITYLQLNICRRELDVEIEISFGFFIN